MSTIHGFDSSPRKHGLDRSEEGARPNKKPKLEGQGTTSSSSSSAGRVFTSSSTSTKRENLDSILSRTLETSPSIEGERPTSPFGSPSSPLANRVVTSLSTPTTPVKSTPTTPVKGRDLSPIRFKALGTLSPMSPMGTLSPIKPTTKSTTSSAPSFSSPTFSRTQNFMAPPPTPNPYSKFKFEVSSKVPPPTPNPYSKSKIEVPPNVFGKIPQPPAVRSAKGTVYQRGAKDYRLFLIL